MKRVQGRDARLVLAGAVAAAVVIVGLLVPIVQKVRAVEAVIDGQRRELEQVRARPMAQSPAQQLAVPDEPGEPSRFLNLLSREVRAANCRLSAMELLPAAPAANPKDGGIALRTVRTRIGLRGRYPALRRLVARLGTAERTLTVVELTVRAHSGVSSGDPAAPTVDASLVLERYLLAGSPQAARPAWKGLANGLVAGTAAASAARPGERNLVDETH